MGVEGEVVPVLGLGRVVRNIYIYAEMRIRDSFSGRRFRSMLFTASVSVCAEFVNVFIDKVVAAQFLGDSALAAIPFFTVSIRG